jgi:hypothetical protein
MNDDLCVGGYLPLTSPYTHDSRSVLGIPDHVVDWVLIQLRETESGPAIDSKSVFLHKDGRIVGDDGVSPFISMEAAPGNYYIVVKHRNHLSGMSSNVHTLLGDASVLYDFTGSGQLYGSNGGLELESGIWGLWNGDINQDGQVTTLDYTDWYQSNHSGETGYVPTDVDLNTAIDNTDYHIWNEAARLKATSNVP